MIGETVAAFARCSACGSSQSPSARYCNQCGRVTLSHVRASALGRHSCSRARSSSGVTFGIGAAGAISAVILATAWHRSGASETSSVLLQSAAIALVAFLCTRREGPIHAWRRASLRSFLLAPLLAATALALAVVYLDQLTFLTNLYRIVEPEASPPPISAWQGACAIVAIPVAEEWLCRGVLFAVARKIMSRGATILVTAILFSLLQEPGEWHPIEIPHYLVLGLGLGFLRDRCGSLFPCILAHSTYIGGAVLLG